MRLRLLLPLLGWSIGLAAFLLSPMPTTSGGRSANLLGTMLCAGFFGVELRVVYDRFFARAK